MSVKELLYNHSKKYPKMQQVDIFKLIHQHLYGGEHLIDNEELVYQRLQEECENLTNKTYKIEDIGNNYVRFHLFHASEIECKTIHQLFIASCNNRNKDESLLFTTLEELGLEKPSDHPPYRHSQTYRDRYLPHYRVLDKSLATLYPLFLRINELIASNKEVVIAIEGKAGSGKSTLATRLSNLYQANVFHLDDFFLQRHQRVPERLLEVGGNVDYERFEQEVLIPLSHKEVIHYQKFLCHKMELDKDVKDYEPSAITIIEGSYSMLERFRKYYDITVALTLEDIKQVSRIYQRNDLEHAKMFQNKWIPLENEYFEYYDIFKQVDYLFDTTDLSL